MYGLRYLQLFICVTFTGIAFFVGYLDLTVRNAIDAVAPALASYLLGLYGSLIIYRVFFHPLKAFPGPLSVKVSSIAFSARLLSLDAHKKVLALHQRHGDFVRVGSSDLSIIHPKAPDAIYGKGSKCTKADWYDLTLPMTSMQTTRKRAEHDKRRRVWGRAFNDLRGYEERVTIFQDQLLAIISAADRKPVNITELYHQFSFDVMGDLAFGASFNMLQSSDYCCELLDKRLKTKVNTPNITSFLVEPWLDKQPLGYDLNVLQGDSQLIIVAGSDTTASTLTNLFYELARKPDLVSKIRDELQPLIKQGGDISDQKLQTLNLLTGVINETLRLHPPVLALQRKTPREGLTIGETYIPGDITVWCPQYVVGRSEKVYADAAHFRPERWYAQRDMIKEASAYAPFSLGTYNCIGKNLALMILRTTLVRVILKYDISFATDEEELAFEDRAKTQFNTLPGQLNLTFHKRSPE
ncbi:uncharacterized protein KY384_006559 [Bacidia gigantensis]|uniref:uncharacterized protein n=1 Tax=Bacidia gigantensis TaxID=2732470 RepID=UPI001D0540FE|nr:uncharacterized protein KY384_006559 [Bacidia gigantensis]KAG8528870.1 hypothetical protein KY384_006559 [Bacidia gigantensis]